MAWLTLSESCHLETLKKSDLIDLYEKRAEIRRAWKVAQQGGLLDAQELAKYFRMIEWITIQIVYVKGLKG